MQLVEALEPTKQMRLKSKDSIIHFEEGLIGFPGCKNFVFMENEDLAPFRLLQSVDTREVGFLVLEPTMLVLDYYERVPVRDWDAVGVTGSIKPLAFVIVIIGATPETSTGNLQAPLLVNYETMTGKQVILSNSSFSVRHPLIDAVQQGAQGARVP